MGKTTISATLALEGALTGKKTLALTIDPAMRLATSLGIVKQRNVRVGRDRFKKAGFAPKGELHVMMLDVKNTFDELIEKTAPSATQRDKILSNKYYQSVANSLAGSQEYMAMEALLSAYEKGDYDLIIVDTPPSRHVLDLLSAPRRLINILDASALKLALKSYSFMSRWSFGFTKIWTSVALKALEKIVGVDVLHDVWEFFMDFESVNEPLKKRARETFRLLKSPESVFLIVTGSGKSVLHDSLHLYNHLSNDRFHVGGIIANRVYPRGDLPNLESETRSLLKAEPDLACKLIQNYKDYTNLINSEEKDFQEFKTKLKNDRVPIITVPYMDTEVYDLEELFKLRGYLFK